MMHDSTSLRAARVSYRVGTLEREAVADVHETEKLRCAKKYTHHHVCTRASPLTEDVWWPEDWPTSLRWAPEAFHKSLLHHRPVWPASNIAKTRSRLVHPSLHLRSTAGPAGGGALCTRASIQRLVDSEAMGTDASNPLGAKGR